MSFDRIVLINPPFSKPCEPTPGMLALTAHLKREGVRVAQFDLNLACHLALLSPESLGPRKKMLEALGAPPSQLKSAERVAGRTAKLLEKLRSPEIYRNPGSYRGALGGLAEGYKLVSRTSSAKITISDFIHEELSPLSTRDLERAFTEPTLITGIQWIEPIVADIVASSPKAVGFSTVYLSQALASFALAGLIRRLGYEGELIIGGGLVSSWGEGILENPAFKRVWDQVVIGPGEETLSLLADGRHLSEAEGKLLFGSDGEGLDWAGYIAPGPILPISTTRGCYWKRCAFCPEAAEDNPYHHSGGDSVADDILRERNRSGVRYVHLTDNAVPPATLRRLAERLEGAGVGWYGFARLEHQLADPGFARTLAHGGCKMLQLGVETASQRLLDLMGKGTDIKAVGPMLKNLVNAGVRTYVYILFNTPSESEAEAVETLEWIKRESDYITFLNLSIMNMPRGSEMEREPERFGLTEVRPLFGEKNDLSLYWGFSNSQHRERRDARKVLAMAKKDPVIKRILARTPKGFTSNHAAFSPID